MLKLGLTVLIALLAACSGGVPVTTNSTTAAASSGSGTTGGTSSSPPTTSPTSVTPLSLQGTPAVTVVAGAAYSFQPTATPTAPTITFAIENPPAWASFDSATGAITGTPTTADIGETANITIAADNGTTSASFGPFSITVTAPPPSPPPATGTATLSWDAPILNTDGTALTDLAGYKIYYGTSATALTQQVSISGASTTTYVVSGLPTGTYYFAVTAFASDGTESASSNVGSKTI